MTNIAQLKRIAKDMESKAELYYRLHEIGNGKWLKTRGDEVLVKYENEDLPRYSKDYGAALLFNIPLEAVEYAERTGCGRDWGTQSADLYFFGLYDLYKKGAKSILRYIEDIHE